MQWCVPTRFAVLEGLGTVAFVAAAILADDPIATAMASIAALTLLTLAVRDTVARIRLTVDADGITVIHGYVGRRRITWPEIAAIRVDERNRLGLTSRLLELDTGDAVHLLSGRELGADPADVARALRAFAA